MDFTSVAEIKYEVYLPTSKVHQIVRNKNDNYIYESLLFFFSIFLKFWRVLV